MARNQVTLTFAGDTRSLERSFGKVGDESNKLAGKLGTIAKAGAAAGLVALGVAAKIGWDEMQQGQKVAAQTTAVLKSTGGAANVTAGQIDALGLALMRKSGTDDEAIKSGANLLLTFTNVRNEAGKGRDIFTQATAAALDLSVAFGKDMASSSVLVGKALNDPIKGISALSKVGITFTQGQKDSIAAMMGMNDTAGAQKLILGELNRQVGGSAAAFGKTLPGKINIAKESFSNLAGALMTNLLPAINAILSLALQVVDAFANIGRGFVAKDPRRPLDIKTSQKPGVGLPPGLKVVRGKVLPTKPPPTKTTLPPAFQQEVNTQQQESWSSAWAAAAVAPRSRRATPKELAAAGIELDTSTSPGKLAYAFAQMTTDMGDDLRALQTLATEAEAAYAAARKTGLATVQVEALAALKSARDALYGLGPMAAGGGALIQGSGEGERMDLLTQTLSGKAGAAATKAIYLNVNSQSLDPQAAATAVVKALQEYVRLNGPVAGVAA